MILAGTCQWRVIGVYTYTLTGNSVNISNTTGTFTNPWPYRGTQFIDLRWSALPLRYCSDSSVEPVLYTCQHSHYFNEWQSMLRWYTHINHYNATDLNDNTQWVWYTGSCGGTPFASGSSIDFVPTATTTYYVRGEGGCSTNGLCASPVVIVNPQIVMNVSNDPIACHGNDITTHVNANGGTPPYAGEGTFVVPGFTGSDTTILIRLWMRSDVLLQTISLLRNLRNLY